MMSRNQYKVTFTFLPECHMIPVPRRNRVKTWLLLLCYVVLCEIPGMGKLSSCYVVLCEIQGMGQLLL